MVTPLIDCVGAVVRCDVKLRWKLSHIDLSRDTPESADLSHIPEWLVTPVREMLARMDYANKKNGAVVNTDAVTVDVKIDRADLWKYGPDLGDYEIVDESPVDGGPDE